MDSSGLHLIEALRGRTSERGGAIVVVVATYGVRRLLEIAPPASDVRVVMTRPPAGTAGGTPRVYRPALDHGRVEAA
jgi:hypothetical protein